MIFIDAHTRTKGESPAESPPRPLYTILLLFVVVLTLITVLMPGQASAQGFTYAVSNVTTGYSSDPCLRLGIDSAGVEHIFYNPNAAHLDVATYTGGSWGLTQIDTNPGYGISTAKDANGNIAVVAGDFTDVYYYVWGGSSYTKTNPITNESTSIYQTSLAFDGNGHPGILYANTASYVEYAYYTGTAWTFRQVSTSTVSGEGSFALAFDSSNVAHVVYTVSNAVKYAVESGTIWTTSTPTVDAASYVSIAKYPNGNFGVVGETSAQNLLSWDIYNVTTSSWTTQTIDTDGVSNGISLTLAFSGYSPMIGYKHRTTEPSRVT